MISMRVKFRLCLDDKGNRVTRIFFVGNNESLELITQMPGWVGLDFDHMSKDSVDTVADTIANKADTSKYVE